MIVEPDFLDHWKTQLLGRLLGTDKAPLYVLRLWAHCQQRKTGRFTGWEPDVLASVCRWDGDGLLFWDAMMKTFMEKDGDDVIAHGWAEANAGLVSAWSNGKLGGRPRKSGGNKPSNNRPVNRSETDRVSDRVDRVDKGEEIKKTEQPVVSQWEVAHGTEMPESLRTENCMEAVRLWLKHKSELREGYKPTGLKMALTKWANEFTPATFPLAVESSIACNYRGVFPPKQNWKQPVTPLNQSNEGRDWSIPPVEPKNYHKGNALCPELQ